MHDDNGDLADVPDAWERQAEAGCFSEIPQPFSWSKSARLAHLLNGYTVMGPDRLGRFANTRLEHSRRTGRWQGDASELWCCLFYEHRRWRHFGLEPEGEDAEVLDGLCEALRQRLVELDANGRTALMDLIARHPFPGAGA